MTAIHVLLIGNDTILDLDRLKNEVNGAFINNAEVAVTLLDAAGQQVTGSTWPKTLAYVASSDGLYRATLPYTLVLVENARYTAQLAVNAGTGLQGAWTVECVARTRG